MGVTGYGCDCLFNVTIYGDDAAIRECMGKRNVRFDELIAIEQTEFLRDRRKVCELIAARMNVRPEAGQCLLLSDRHTSDLVVLFKDKNL